MYAWFPWELVAYPFRSTEHNLGGKIVLVQAMKLHSGNRGIAPLIINRGDRLSGKLHASAT